MKRSIIGIALALSLFLAPLAHADFAPVSIGNPYIDTLQLWNGTATAPPLLRTTLRPYHTAKNS